MMALSLKRGNAILLFLLTIVVGMFVSCERADFGDSDEESEGQTQTGKASLTVKTRATTTDGEEISYPVSVYVMDADGKCVETSQLDSDEDKLTFTLTAGTYDVYAIAGADEDSYTLPTKNDATKASAIILRDGMEHGDLMVSSDNVVLSKNEKNTLTLAMTRKVSKIEALKIEGLTGDVTGVEVTLSPLVKYILLDGSNSEETMAKTIQLTNASDGTWINNSGIYITESTSNLTIKVGITAAGSKTTYTCNYKKKVEANHKLTINGNYSDNNIILQGVLTGTQWGDPVTIDFEINADETGNENNSGNDDNQENSENDEPTNGNAPKVGSVYDNCVVIKSKTSGSSTTVTLMTLEERNKLSYSKSQKGKDNAKFQAEIASCIEETLALYDDSNLRLPTLEEIEFVADNRELINSYIENNDANAPLVELKGGAFYCGYYYLADDDNIYVYTLDGQIDQEPNPNRVTYKVRGFKTLTFTN